MRLSPLRDQPALFLVQHEWIGVSAQFCDNERNALGHQTGNERDVA
jgi:hypothetical protein